MSSKRKVRPGGAEVAGERVFLRRPAPRDAAEFTALNRASARLHRGFVSPPLKAEQFEAFLKRSRRADCESFFVCRVEDAAIAGSITLSQISRAGFQSAYLGYYVGEPYAGRGYMTEAVGLILRHAFARMRLHRLEANIQPENAASIALVKRAGFVREGFSRRYLKICGRWRDHERWAILSEDWAASGRSRRGPPAENRKTENRLH